MVSLHSLRQERKLILSSTLPSSHRYYWYRTVEPTLRSELAYSPVPGSSFPYAARHCPFFERSSV